MFPAKRAIDTLKKRAFVLVCSLIFASAISSAQDAVLDDFVAKVFRNCKEPGVYYFGPLVQPVALCTLAQMSPAKDCKAVYELRDVQFSLGSNARIEGSTLVLAQYSEARQRLIIDDVWKKWMPYLKKQDSKPYVFGEFRGGSWHIGYDLQPLGAFAGIMPGTEVTVDQIDASKVVCDGHGDVTLPVAKPPGPEELERIYQEARRFLDNRDFVDAKPLLDKACLYGNAASCGEFGFVYLKGELVGRDYYKALILSERACNGGNMSGCSNLGFLYANGYGAEFPDQFGYGPPALDYVRARALFAKSCDGGSTSGCIGLGVLYAHGKGVKKDKEKARSYFEKACHAGNPEGCKDLNAIR